MIAGVLHFDPTPNSVISTEDALRHRIQSTFTEGMAPRKPPYS